MTEKLNGCVLGLGFGGGEADGWSEHVGNVGAGMGCNGNDVHVTWVKCVWMRADQTGGGDLGNRE